MTVIELGEIDFNAKFGAVSLTHFDIFDLSVLAEVVLEDDYFIKPVWSQCSLLNCVDSLIR